MNMCLSGLLQAAHFLPFFARAALPGRFIAGFFTPPGFPFLGPLPPPACACVRRYVCVHAQLRRNF
eukprot:scaffold103778_cov11-Tisochrysis_lutea.AAC.1